MHEHAKLAEISSQQVELFPQFPLLTRHLFSTQFVPLSYGEINPSIQLHVKFGGDVTVPKQNELSSHVRKQSLTEIKVYRHRESKQK